MKPSVPPTSLTESDAPRLDEERPPPAPPPQPEPAARRSGWTAGRITALVIGTVLVLFSLALLGAGGTALWADRTQRDGGYATTDVHQFATSGWALATEPTDLGSAGVEWLYSPDLLGEVRIRVTPASPDQAVFVGIGPSADVESYLAGVGHTVVTEFWEDKVEAVDGGAPGSAPGTQGFWAASVTGSGAQSLTWDPEDGEWTVVVMNADGQPGLDVGADLGARVPALPWVGLGVLIAGAILLAGGALLIVSAVRGPRAGRVGTATAES